MRVIVKRGRKRSPTAPTATERLSQDALIEVARTKLLALGEFSHRHVRRQDEHIVIEQPGLPDAPEDRAPVLRLTPISGFRFGLSLRPSSGRWEILPASGVLADVLAERRSHPRSLACP